MRYTINTYKKVLFLLVILLIIPFAGNSQVRGTGGAATAASGPRILTGMVRNASGPLMGVAVQVINENSRSVGGNYTTANGEFYLRIEPGQNLSISFAYLGYQTQTVRYQGQATIDILLVQDVLTINTVKITERGVVKNDMDIPIQNTGAAVSRMEMADFEGIPAASAADLMYGAMSGVDITSMSGDPGAKSSIRIRGISSLNASNEPLFVVDGIPYEPPGSVEDFSYQTADENDFGALLNINPSDIQSIEVLMDAMAVLTWGPKGANGVLVITTKSGTPGKTRFRIIERFDSSSEPKRIPLLDGKQYVTLMQDAMWNRMGDVGYTWSNMEGLLKYPEINYDPNYQYFDEYSVNTDWLDLVRKNDYTNEISFSMEGGGDRAKYIFSLTNTDQGGTTIGTNFNRLTARLKVDYRFSNKFLVTSSIDYTQNKKDEQVPYGGTNPRAIAEIKMPNMSPYVLDEDGNPTSEYFIPQKIGTTYSPFQGVYPDTYNPLAMVNEAINKLTSQAINIVVRMNYNIFDNNSNSLTYKNDISLRLTSSNRRTFLPELATGVASSDQYFNQAREMKSDNMYIYVNNQLTYSKFFDRERKTSLYVATKFNFEESASSSFSEEARALADVSMSDPVTGGLIGALGSGTTKSRSVMSSTSAVFTYKERYSATAGWSLGGSTKLGPKARWQGFPTVSGVWHFGQEGFIKNNLRWLNEGRLSMTWGKSGRGPTSDFSYIGTFASLGDYMGESAVAPSSIQADNLKMEVNRQINIQLEVTFLRNFTAKVSYYDKKDTDQLQKDAKIPWSTGFATISWYNSGSSSNKGVNVEFSFRNILKHKDWKLSGGANFSLNRNRITELPSNGIENQYTFGNGNYARSITLNDPIGSLYGYKNEGVYQTYDDIIARDKNGEIIRDIIGNPVYTSINNVQLHPGDAKYTDMNYDGVIDKYDIVYLGNSQPLFYSGQNISVRYKNLEMKVRGYLYVGNKIINRARINTENMRNSNNQSTAVLRRWRHEGDDTEIPRAIWERGYNYLGSDRFVDGGTYFRIKNITLTYYLGEKLGRKLGLRPNSTSIYLSGYDLFTITDYSGQNPEQSSGSGMFPVSEDNSRTPRPIKISVGVTIDF